MKQLSFCIYTALLCAFVLTACSKKDESHLDFVDKDKLTFMGRVDSLRAFSGTSRVKLTWIAPADPNVTKLRIFWNNRADSSEIPVTDDKRQKKMETIVSGLIEGKQSIEIITYDDAGHRSVPTEVLAEAFGAQYISSLLPRTIRNAELYGTDVKLQFFKADPAITSTEVKYTDATATERTVVIFNKDSIATLPNFPAGGNFEYRSWFKPDSFAIDTLAPTWLKTGPKENISATYLKNNKYPFAYSIWDGTRYGSVKDWTENTAAKQKGTGKIYGAFDGQTLALSKAVAADGNITDGKVTQTITLPAGKYELVWTNEGLPTPDNAGTQPRFIAVAPGNDIPNTAQLNATTTLGYASFIGVTTARAPFTLSAETKVTVGIVVNFSTAPQSFKTFEVRLLKVPE